MANTEKEVLDIAARAGKILLENGAEISRIEETMDRIIRSFSIVSHDYYVLSNGIFLTENTRDKTYAKVGHIPIGATRLDKVIEVNSLSRKIVNGELRDTDRISEELDRIEGIESYSNTVMAVSAAIGSAGFAYVMGGSVKDSINALIGGLVVYLCTVLSSRLKFSKITLNILSVMLGCIASIVIYHFGLGDNMNAIIAGTVVPQIPGIAFINAIRDIGNGDYLSGSIRMLDALLTFLCIAVGAAFSLGLYRLITGGMLI
jgi:uncharacterized membrane protein YjjP (DUF1212 family)